MNYLFFANYQFIPDTKDVGVFLVKTNKTSCQLDTLSHKVVVKSMDFDD